MVRALGSFRRRPLLVAATLVAGAIALVALQQGTSTASRIPEDPAERLVLRLHDLPLGYFPFVPEGRDSELICEPLDPADPQPALASFIRRFSPEGCMVIYLRFYRVPGLGPSAELVGTAALDAGSIPAAEAGLALAPQILSHITEDEMPEEIATTTAVGDATRRFHWLHVPSFFGRAERTGAFLAWRSGDVLATVFASAGSLKASDLIVEGLARRQQAHIENPTPYTRADGTPVKSAWMTPR